MKRFQSPGFTLIEIMVVVVIIGIMITFAVLSIGGRSLDDRLGLEARRLDELLALAADEAVQQGVEIGFLQTEEGYEFLARRDGKWLPLDAGPLRSRAIEEPMFMALTVEGRPAPPYKRADREKTPPKPQVLLLSSGESTEFTLDLRARDFAPHYLIQGDVVGRVKLERKDS